MRIDIFMLIKVARMPNFIIIETDPSGERLYQTCRAGHDDYVTQLDQQQQWDKTLKALETLDPDLFKSKGYQNLKGLLMTSAILTIASADLSIVVSSLYISKQRLEQAFYMKSAYLIIYETYIAYQNKQRLFKDEAVEAGGDFVAKHLAASTDWRKFINDFKLATEVKAVRNQTGGHIHHDFGEWHATICGLDPQYTADMLNAFLSCLQAIQHLLNNLLARRFSMLLAEGEASKNRTLKMLNDMEVLQEKINLNQAENNKLDLDFSIVRNMLSKS